jgi:lipoyl(octanoyl) transferase
MKARVFNKQGAPNQGRPAVALANCRPAVYLGVMDPDVIAGPRPAAGLFRPEPVAWEVAGQLTDYAEAVARMEREAAAIAAGGACERIWLVEHAPLYTAGTSARSGDLIDATRFPVHRSGRGGQFTYHGPGQRVAYVMLDLGRRGQDVRAFVTGLESWIIAMLAEFGVAGETRHDRVGVWVRRPDKDGGAEDKIAAIGIRVRRWVTFHGIAVNVAPELEHFSGIVPCGVTGHGVTSLADLGVAATMAEVDAALRRCFEPIFGPTEG